MCVVSLHKHEILIGLSSFTMVRACSQQREALYDGVMLFLVIRETSSHDVGGPVLRVMLVKLKYILYHIQRVIYL